MRGCPKCNGDGCEYCEYSGLDVKYAREHRGLSKVTCPECRGVGKVEGGNCEPPHIECPTCKGTGFVES